MKTVRNMPFHPYLFAVAPIFYLFMKNRTQLTLNEALFSVISLLVAVFIINGLLNLFLRAHKKTALISSLLVLFFYLYRNIHNITERWSGGAAVFGAPVVIFAIAGLSVLVAGYLLKKSQREFIILNTYLNFTALIIIFIAVFNFTNIEYIRVKNQASRRNNRHLAKYYHESSAATASSSRTNNNRPDIYYIILDTYARADTLSDIYNYDNNAFIEILQKKGFYVAEKSHSNYTFTQLSLASSLNMEYINYLGPALGKSSRDPSVAYQMIRNNNAVKFVKSKGYQFINISTGWGPTKTNRLADINYGYYPYFFNEFNRVFIESTALAPITRRFSLDQSRNRILFNFKKLGEIPEIKGPTFTFAHILAPHQPYLFDRTGRPVYQGRFEMGGDVWKYKDAYLDQLIYTNKLLSATVDKIIKSSKNPPIIILQADHGPASSKGWDHPRALLLNERMGIFNAYYLPAQGDKILYPSITPVNSLRLVFNYYLGADFKKLDDESFFSTKVKPHNFINVTDKLK